MARKYTTQAKVENYLLITVDSDFSTQIDFWIEEMTKFIEKETRRQFIADETATVRLYEVEGEDSEAIGGYSKAVKSLRIDEAVEVTAVKVDGVTVGTTIWLSYPANSLPKTRVKIKDTASVSFSLGEQNIEVTAKWGYSVAVPDDIRFACTVLTAGVIQHSLPHKGDMNSLTMGRYSVSYKNKKQVSDFEFAQKIIDNYKKISIC